jgi:hypothetical protein
VTHQATRFFYGGHLTFPLRYGWLPKGLECLDTSGEFQPSTDTADELGLGSKMVESLAFWLRAMGLSQGGSSTEPGRGATPMAAAIRRFDPYCELPGTWWFLHLALCSYEGTVWSWFFNDYNERHFDRLTCVDAYQQHTRSRAVRPASPAMAQKDVACLLSAYASRPGIDIVDPDELGACPLRELGLVYRHDLIRRYERSRSPVGLPIEAFAASVSSLAELTGRDSLSIRELSMLRLGPGRIFCAGLDALESKASEAAQAPSLARHIHVETLAGERHVRVAVRPWVEWIGDFYARLGTAR